MANQPYTKYQRRLLDIRTYRAKHRNILRAEGKLGQDHEIAKTTNGPHPHLIDWPNFPTTKFAWYHNEGRVRDQLQAVSSNEGMVEIDITDDGQLDLRDAIEVCNVS